MWFAIDTLEYLRKGGRIGAAQAFLGSALQIKPILTLEEEITPIERVRTRRRAFERMVEFAHERKEAGATTWVVQHIHDPDTARKLVDECRQVFGNDPVFVSEIGPVIGAHIGPGLIGFGGIGSEFVCRTPVRVGRRLRAAVRAAPESRRKTYRRSATSRRTQQTSFGAVSGPLAAAAQHHPGADGEADDRGADDQLAAVLADLAAPVGELGDLAAKGDDRMRELVPLALDVVADLLGRAAGRAGGDAWRRARRRRSGRCRRHSYLRLLHRAPWRRAWSRTSSVWRIRLPSSIAIVGNRWCALLQRPYAK